MILRLLLIFSYSFAFVFSAMYMVVYLNTKRPRYYLSFSILSFCLGLYLLSLSFLYREIETIFLTKMLYICLMASTVSYAYFTSDMIDASAFMKQVARTNALLIAVLTLVFVYYLLMEKSFVDFYSDGITRVRHGEMYPFYNALFFYSVLSSFILMLIHYVKYKKYPNFHYNAIFLVMQGSVILSLLFITPVFTINNHLLQPAPFEYANMYEQINIGASLMLIFPMAGYALLFFGRIKHLFGALEDNRRAIDTLLNKTKANTHHMLDTMRKMIEQRDEKTSGHSSRVAHYSAMLAESLGYSKKGVDLVYTGALLHDIGKIGVPEKLLHSKGVIRKKDLDALKRHPEIGVEILSYIDDFLPASDCIYYHHERYDGLGFPDGLSGKSIPEIARIVSVCNVYDSIISEDSFGRKISSESALAIIERLKGTLLDPDIACVFIDKIHAINKFTSNKEQLC